MYQLTSSPPRCIGWVSDLMYYYITKCNVVNRRTWSAVTLLDGHCSGGSCDGDVVKGDVEDVRDRFTSNFKSGRFRL